MKVYVLLVCLWFIIPLENFSLIWRRHHCRWRTANVDLCSALMAICIEQWGFFTVPHLLCHRACVYNGHLRERLTLTCIAERGAVTTCFHNLGLSRLEFEHPTFRLRVQRSNPLRHRRVKGLICCWCSIEKLNNQSNFYFLAIPSKRTYIWGAKEWNLLCIHELWNIRIYILCAKRDTLICMN